MYNIHSIDDQNIINWLFVENNINFIFFVIIILKNSNKYSILLNYFWNMNKPYTH